MCFGGTVSVLVERQLAALIGHIGRSHPKPDQSPANARPGVTTGMIEPGLQLPPDTIGQRCIVERIGTSPGARPQLAVRCFGHDLDTMRGHTVGRELDEEPVGERSSCEPGLLQVLQWWGETLFDGEVGRERPGMGGPILASGELMGSEPFGAES